MIANYSQLTIKQFLQCKLIAELEPDPLIRKMKMLAEVSAISFEDIETLPLGELVEALKDLSQIESLPEDSKIKMKFKLGGKRWTAKWRQQELTGEQYIDTTHFCKDPDKIVSNIHLILASLVVERTWYGRELPYSGETHADRADLFYREMKIENAYPIMLFFCEYYKRLADNILTCLLTQGEKLVKQMEQRFGKNGGGLQQSTT